MSTTNVGFVKNTNAVLVGATVGAAGAVGTLNGTDADQLNASGNVTRIDKVVIDLATAGYAKNGAASYALVGTTPVTFSLAALDTGAASSAGDLAFASWSVLVFRNPSATDITVAPAGSNPASILLGGTSPTLTIPAGSTIPLVSLAPVVVDGTHKSITVTPAASGSFSISVGGA